MKLFRKASLESARRKRILVLEDDNVASLLWRRILDRTFGEVEVTVVKSVEEARSRMRNAHERFDLIVTDVYLEGVGNGVDFWKSQSARDTPLLICSSRPAAELESLYGTFSERPHFLPKPISPSFAAGVIKFLLEGGE